MSVVDDLVKHIYHGVSDTQIRAARYLEAHGYQLLVHFGWDNVIEKARDHWSAQKKVRKRLRKRRQQAGRVVQWPTAAAV